MVWTLKDFKEKHIWDKPNEPIQNTIQLLYNPNMSVPQENDPEYMLSGGERAKVELMRLLNEPVDLLMLDEPGVALEKEACSQLIQAVNAFPGGGDPDLARRGGHRKLPRAPVD